MSAAAIQSRHVLEAACRQVGLPAEGAEPIRIAGNAIWRLSVGIVARIGRPGGQAVGGRELAVARWLTEEGISTVRPAVTDRPVLVDGRPVTFWVELPPHRPGTAADIAGLLKQMHELVPPDALGLPPLEPLAKPRRRISEAGILTSDDRRWLQEQVDQLTAGFASLPASLPPRALHGDAWDGNVAVDADGTAYLLDLGNTCYGPPEWDLVSTVVKHLTTATVTAAEYEDFCATYGMDVTTWLGYPVLAGIRELRMVTFSLQIADEHPHARAEAQHRVDCLRGRKGPRPWTWTAVP
ncbi:aminoglycoside phosphotransferase family protein [Streptomyces roseoverticillatus]|uniref:phosphotransferase enzyme family protein n=1 Tax=Streptomyces roseoverticillatus TaxID=66429 RepID=UPI001F410545|nr:aminoglycoside phosphotransferase family protein [Streptomyces roseoverticillatus]MCF3104853.1 aminoglycoside phosphotransferase family protein [Streptomyces roseoverticillatus]